MQPVRALFFVLPFILLAGCKHVPARAECSAHQGVAWREVVSPHFRVRTNLDSKHAHEAAVELEKMRKALLFAWHQTAFDPPGKLDVVILQSREQLQEFGGENALAYFIRDDVGPLIVLSGSSYTFDDVSEQSAVTHELAHYLSAYVLHRQPRWIAEGLAGYLETTRPYGEGNEYRMGEANLPLLYWAKTHARVSWEDLWSWNAQELRQAEQVSYYATSWLWVHFLMNAHTERFSAFQQRLGRAEDPRAAWEASFAGIPHQTLERELNAYLKHGRYSAFRYPVSVKLGDFVERPLSDADAHAIRARLASVQLGNHRTPEEWTQEQKKELVLALERDPKSFEVMRRQILMAEGDERLLLTRALVEAHPDRSEAWNQLAVELFKRPGAEAERREAAVKAVQLDPENADGLNHLAWDYVVTGKPKIAVPLARKAVSLAPWSPAILDTYAAALAGAGSCADAAAIQRRALDMLSERASKDARAHYEQQLRKYEGGCVATSAP